MPTELVPIHFAESTAEALLVRQLLDAVGIGCLVDPAYPLPLECRFPWAPGIQLSVAAPMERKARQVLRSNLAGLE